MSAVARRAPAVAPAPRADNRLPLVLDDADADEIIAIVRRVFGA